MGRQALPVEGRQDFHHGLHCDFGGERFAARPRTWYSCRPALTYQCPWSKLYTTPLYPARALITAAGCRGVRHMRNLCISLLLYLDISLLLYIDWSMYLARHAEEPLALRERLEDTPQDPHRYSIQRYSQSTFFGGTLGFPLRLLSLILPLPQHCSCEQAMTPCYILPCCGCFCRSKGTGFCIS